MADPSPPNSTGSTGECHVDLDHADPAYNRNAHGIWDALRPRCPMVHSPAYGGTWLPLTYELVRAIANDPEHFSNHGAVVGRVAASEPPPVGSAPPISSDPPFHREAKRLLLPAFAPRRMEAKEAEVRQVCRECLEALGSRGLGSSVDGAVEYAQHIPVRVMARMLGVPRDDEDLLRRFVHELLEGVGRPPEEQRRTRDEVDAYLDALIQRHREHPADTLVTELMEARLSGEALEHRHLRGMILLLLMAGIDTTWSAIGSGLWHLATHPDDRARLLREPELWPTALEELLRAYAPVTMGRVVTQDVELAGHTLREGEWVLLAFPAANRDPDVFPDAQRVILDRAVNRHAAFGLGIHRCIGSNLARLELRVALEEFLGRFPHFHLEDPDAVRWSSGQIRGPRVLPLRIGEPAAG